MYYYLFLEHLLQLAAHKSKQDTGLVLRLTNRKVREKGNGMEKTEVGDLTITKYCT